MGDAVFRKIETLKDIFGRAAGIFSSLRDELQETGTMAEGIYGTIREADPFIQDNTSLVCPGCPAVCCVNRHSYHDMADMIYLIALGEPLPDYRDRIGDTEPCQFLGEEGCTVGRPVRPHRCNWYFCTPLLERMQASSARSYRAFISGLRTINERRAELLETFAAVSAREGHDFESLKRSSDEIFFRHKVFR